MNSKQFSIVLLMAASISCYALYASDDQKKRLSRLEQRASLLLTNINESDGHETSNNPRVITDEAVEQELDAIAEECDFLVSCGIFNDLSREDIRELTDIRNHGGDWKTKLQEKLR